MKNRDRSALEYYTTNRPVILTPIMADPSPKMTDTDAATGISLGTLAAFALRRKGNPTLSSTRIGVILAKGLSRSGIASSVENNIDKQPYK